MTKRQFLLAGGAACAAFAQKKRRMVRTKKLFKAPPGYPNGLAATPEGIWVAEQTLSGRQATSYGLPEPRSLTEEAWLMDWNGKVVKQVTTHSRNTSGMAVGDGFVWMVANAPPQGVFQVDMNSKQVSHRQIPLGPATDGGGSHGAQWDNGKLWISALRLRANIRVDPKTWVPEIIIPFYQSPDHGRFHDITIEGDSMWQIVGNDCKNYKDYRPALVRYELSTGKVQETVDFLPNSCDPHGLAFYQGKLYGCDAGIHPNWTNNDSPTTGWIFEIEFV